MIFGSTDVSALRLGASEVSKVYLGASEVWSSGFNPLSLSPSLWLDASDSSRLFDAVSGGSLVADDGLVARWEDKSGNGNHATRSDSGTRPARRAGEINGLGAIDFSGSKYLNLASTTPATAEHSEFFVFNRTASGTPNPILTKSGTDFEFSAYYYSDNGIYYFPGSVEFAGGLATTTGVIALGGLRGGGSTVIRRNGATHNTLGSAGTGNAEYNLIGSRNLTEFHNSAICEILVFDYLLSTEERDAVESYLMTKWGI